MALEKLGNGLELWDRFLGVAGTTIQTQDIADVLEVRGTPYDGDEMTFEADFRLKGGGDIRLTAKYSPTWDAVGTCRIIPLRYN